MFKRYECGCVGFVVNGMMTEPGGKQIWCVKACDADGVDNPYGLYRRDELQAKPSRMLKDDELHKLFRDLAQLVEDGHAMRELRIAFRGAGLGAP